MADKNEEQNNAQQGQDNNKDAKKFDANLKKFMLLLNNDPKVFKSKLPNDQVSGAIEEMLKENREETRKRVMAKAKALLTKKVEFDKFVKAKQAEMEKAILDKKKEFSKEMDDLFADIENIDTLAKDMAAVLAEAAGGAAEEPGQENGNNEPA